MKKLLYSIFIIALLGSLSCNEDFIEPELFGSIFGEVLLDNNDNIPIEEAKITTNPPTNTVFTDEFGRFALENISPGTYTIRIEKQGFVTDLETLTLNEDRTLNIIIKMTPDVSINTVPSQPFNPSPSNNSKDQELSVQLSWQADDIDNDILTYDVLLYNADQTESQLILSNDTATSVLLENLDFNSVYFWQVAVRDDSSEPIYSEVWSFETKDFPNHRFLFARQENNQYNIFSSDEDGNSIQLTDNGANNWRPKLSPNRDKIAYISDLGIESHIYIMNRDGSDPRKVTTVPIAGFNKLELEFTWSPDGTELLYMNNAKLYRIKIDGTGLSLFTEAPLGFTFTECDWNGQNNRIMARTTGNNTFNSAIYLFDVQGNYLLQMIPDNNGSTGGGVFSIDGNTILYTHDSSGFESVEGRQLDANIFTRHLLTQISTNVSNEKPAGTNDLDPQYSPDGSKIIFTNTNNDGISPRSIWMVDLDGDNRQLLFENAEMPNWR